MRLKAIFLFVLFATTISSYSQTNLVPNPGFDEVQKKIKEGGMIELATHWSSPTDAPADIFSGDSKNDDYLVPDNIYGREETKSGEGYAGIITYSYKGAVPRSYLQAQLTQPLEAGKRYCIKFHVTVSELSKYSINNVGLFVSEEAPGKKEILAGEINPQVIHSRNKIIEEMDYWKPICRIYKAEGGEQYITIGNFATDEATKSEKMRRPRGFTNPQHTLAYYYVEDVKVIPLEEMLDECVCEENTKEANVVYQSNLSEEVEMKTEDIITLKKAYFPAKSAEILDNSYQTLDLIVDLMKKHPEIKIELHGHTDPVEQLRLTGEDTELSANRANSVKNYLEEKGIASDRLEMKGLKDSQPLSEEGTAESNAQNRRVDFVVVE